MAFAMVLTMGVLSAQEVGSIAMEGETIEYKYTPIDQTSHTHTGIEGFGLRLNNYLAMTDSYDRKVKFSVIGGPAYSTNTGLRLAASATMHYRTAGITSPHSLSISGMVSLRGCYSLALEGKNYLGTTRHTLTYGGGISQMPTYLYGLDYATSAVGTYGEYTSRDYHAFLRYAYRITDALTVGVAAEYDHERVRVMDDYAGHILEGCDDSFSGLGVGLNAIFSTRRTEEVNLTRGVYVGVEYMIHPKALTSCHNTLHEVNITLDYYQPLWRGGLIVVDLYGEHHSADTPWLMCAKMGGDSRMRGYYYGRYVGTAMATAQVELRQRVWEGLVVAGWGGCGVIFSPQDRVSRQRVLPTYGAGIRWYVNPTMAVRIDYGFGRGCSALIVGYSEAF